VLKSHVSSPPSIYTWQKGCVEDYWLYKGEERTGMLISTCPRLWLLGKGFKLKHPVFHIIFFLPGDSHKHIDLIDMPTLREAKKLAECYYEKWLKVKDDPNMFSGFLTNAILPK
jgi:hypothetical protein